MAVCDVEGGGVGGGEVAGERAVHAPHGAVPSICFTVSSVGVTYCWRVGEINCHYDQLTVPVPAVKTVTLSIPTVVVVEVRPAEIVGDGPRYRRITTPDPPLPAG